MKALEWIIGIIAGFVSGLALRIWIKEPSVSKMKYDRKKEEFYDTGRNQYEDIQATKEKMRIEAQKNLTTERGIS
ncbi:MULTISPECIES: hypothetical protein [Halobacillus]|uniref:Uncharacterized protein n=1 Tax=Halobacillus aidingensis TaxID=240303 RepID=A0A1H0EDP0_HALAD|nr:MULTISPECIES: hypothetical protein [Halobacillus]SDN80430.1 hypothetical protein SAMN05421677_101165 [Halobacillus aidingensis]